MSSLEATARAMVDFYKKMNGEIKNLDMLPADQKNLSNNANIRPNKNSKLETNDTKPQSSSLKKSLPISWAQRGNVTFRIVISSDQIDQVIS